MAIDGLDDAAAWQHIEGCQSRPLLAWEVYRRGAVRLEAVKKNARLTSGATDGVELCGRKNKKKNGGSNCR